MIYLNDEIFDVLSDVEICCVMKMARHINDEDGAVEIFVEDTLIETKTNMYKYLKIGKVTGTSLLENLDKLNLLKVITVGRKTKFYMNAEYIAKIKKEQELLPITFCKNNNKDFSSQQNYHIYFLYSNKKELLYIGKTNAIENRIYQHRYDKKIGKINWKKRIMYYKEVQLPTEGDMSIYEIYYIKKMKPIYNKEFNDDSCVEIMLPDLHISNYIKF